MLVKRTAKATTKTGAARIVIFTGRSFKGIIVGSATTCVGLATSVVFVTQTFVSTKQ